MVEAVEFIFRSERDVRERRKGYEESVKKRAKRDWKLRGKPDHELKVVAMLENLRDSRTIEDFGDQGWQHSRVQSFALCLLVYQMDEVIQILKEIRDDRANSPAPVPGGRPVDVGRHPRQVPPPPEAPSSPHYDPALFCVQDDCNGDCSLPCWDGPGISDGTTRWLRVARHAVNWELAAAGGKPPGSA